MFNFFGIFFPKKMIGVDIGTSSIKVIEISKLGGGKTLENYGELKSEFLYQDASGPQKNNYLLSHTFVARALRAILEEARIKTRRAIFSLPDFSTFCTSFDMPPMTEKEIPDAIRYNASQYITLPISEVTLDWHVVPNGLHAKNAALKVFLIAVPNQLIQDYQNIAKMAGLELYALESEALGAMRALVKDTTKTVCLVDIGVQSSSINIIDKGFLKKSYSFGFNSAQLGRAIASVLGVPAEQANEIKNTQGLRHPRQDVVQGLTTLLESLLVEVRSVLAEFAQLEQKQVDQIYLTGGTANLPGLQEYFTDHLKKEVVVPNCFSTFLYPPIFEKTLQEMSPSFSVACGVALGGLES